MLGKSSANVDFAAVYCHVIDIVNIYSYLSEGKEVAYKMIRY